MNSSKGILASYVIYKDGSKTNALNGDTGQIDFSSIDPKNVIENAVNSMSHGQTLFIKNGDYNPSDVININKAVNIVGEGTISTYVNDGRLAGTTISRKGPVMNIIITGTMLTNPIIKDIGLNSGNKTGSTLTLNGFHGSLYNVIVTNGNIGLDVVNSWSTRYFNVASINNKIGCQLKTSISNSNFFGCRFYVNNDIGFQVLDGHQIGFYGCNFEGNGQYGISIEANKVVVLDGCYFEGQPDYNISGKTTGGHVKISGTSLIKLTGCIFGQLETNRNITDAYRIFIYKGTDILIENCLFYQASGYIPGKDIQNDQGSNVNCLLIGCRYIHDGNWLIKGIDGIKAQNTSGLLTENMGISIGTGIQQTIPHNLSTKPSIIFLSNIDNGANPYQSIAADSINIYVIAYNGKRYAWNAKV